MKVQSDVDFRVKWIKHKDGARIQQHHLSKDKDASLPKQLPLFLGNDAQE